MKSVFAIAVATAVAACGFASVASAETVDLNQNETKMIELHDVSSIDLTFALANNLTSYTNYGGYIKWSTRADGRQANDGPWGDCFECGNNGGSWALSYDPYNTSSSVTGSLVDVDFGSIIDTVYVWIRATYGAGSLSYAEATADPVSDTPVSSGPLAGRPGNIGVSDPVELPAVPLPAGGVLILSALGSIVLASRRRKNA